MIERILADAVTSCWPQAPHVRVYSAGTHAASGEPMHGLATAVLLERGLPTDFRSQPLTKEMIEQAGLILTADRGHRAAVVTAVPGAVRRTYCLLQLARLADVTPRQPCADPVSATRTLLEFIPTALAHAPAAAPAADDLADPIAGRIRAYRRCARQIDDAVRRILSPILPS
jgi:protein-tyrosine phosphatase